jgi:M6 family metalloprotease-like protein
MTWKGVAGPPAGAVSSEAFSVAKLQLSSKAVPQTHRVLVLLAEFTDQSALGSAEADWESAMFAPAGSLQHYYDEVSYGMLLMSPAGETYGTVNNGIVGWLQMGYPHPNTGSDTGDPNRSLARDAMIAADPYVDYASFDTNSNGVIDASELSIIVVASGYERSYSGNYGPSVWGHRWSLSLPILAPILDGVVVGDLFSGGGYMQFGEWHRSTSTNGHMATIGIMCHEMGHDLGLPDLYDIGGSSAGIGKWGLMGSGSWGSDEGYSGNSPTHMCAWSKAYLDLLTAQAVGSASGLSVPDVATHDTAYRINTIHPDQYFLLENRQPVGYDRGLPMELGGILVWHIDDAVGSVELNLVNADENHKRVDVEEAEDGLVGFSELDEADNRGDQADLFYSGHINLFEDTTVPSAILYGNIYSGVSISNVSAPGNPMTLDISYTHPSDSDGDGFLPPADCDDTNPAIHPSARETPGDGIDSNCNGDDNCFIATAAFGSRLEGKIDVLRRFRDRHLMHSVSGESLVEAYYRYSPSAARTINQHAWLRTVVRTLLLPLVGFVVLLV